MSCPERQELMTRLSSAFADFTAAVREQRNVSRSAEDPGERFAQVQKTCERAWAELQEHQSRHRCWPPASSGLA